MFEMIVNNFEKLSIDKEILKVQEIAIKNNLTFYDAAYIYVARRNKLKLVTEDKTLLNFPEAINLNTLLKEL
jgi:predicted nucleic acid-binding protein